MIVRSQNKKLIVNLDKIQCISIEPGNAFDKDDVFNVVADGIILGEYSTEEDAIKVLDKIYEEYSKPTVNMVFNGI